MRWRMVVGYTASIAWSLRSALLKCSCRCPFMSAFRDCCWGQWAATKTDERTRSSGALVASKADAVHMTRGIGGRRF
jgi:hypothetical protein